MNLPPSFDSSIENKSEAEDEREAKLLDQLPKPISVDPLKLFKPNAVSKIAVPLTTPSLTAEQALHREALQSTAHDSYVPIRRTPIEELNQGNDDEKEFQKERITNLKSYKRVYQTQKWKRANTKNTDDALTMQDWQLVYDHYAISGSPTAISELTDLPEARVNHLIEYGVMHLNLPAIREYAVSKAQANIDMQRQRREHQKLTHPETQAAIQERVTQEAAIAQTLLTQAAETSVIVSQMLKSIQEAIRNQTTSFHVPEEITPNFVKALTDVAEVQSRLAERAVKLSRLTAGEPTEVIGHRIGVLLAACTTEELLEVEKTGALPRRLTSKAGSEALAEGIGDYEPVRESRNKNRDIIDIDLDKDEQNQDEQDQDDDDDNADPIWAQELDTPEGESQSDPEDDAPFRLNELDT